MRVRSVTERASFVSAAIGIAVGALFLFAPIHGYCMQSAEVLASGATAPPVTLCGTQALWQMQPIFPMPFLAVLVWSLAPTLAYAGVRIRVRGKRGVGSALMIGGALVALSSIISFGAAPMFIPFVFLPTLVTTLIAFARS